MNPAAFLGSARRQVSVQDRGHSNGLVQSQDAQSGLVGRSSVGETTAPRDPILVVDLDDIQRERRSESRTFPRFCQDGTWCNRSPKGDGAVAPQHV